MELERSHYEGATQEMTQKVEPSPSASRAFELSGEDATDIYCFLHPVSKPAHMAIALAKQHVPELLFRRDTAGRDSQALDDADHGSQKRPIYDIALRCSLKSKDPELGWTFGRNVEKCDFPLLTSVETMKISNMQFRIFINIEGILMLQDTSTNGTILDGKHLNSKRAGCETQQMLLNGSVIKVAIDYRSTANITFMVRLPTQEGDSTLENERFARLMEHAEQLDDDVPVHKGRSLLLNNVGANTFGMHWHGGSEYNVIGQIGKGAFATVYKLATKKEGKVFAAKELDKQRLARRGSTDIRIDNEMKIMKALTHPNIVQYEDCFEVNRYIYILMEFVPHGDLLPFTHRGSRLPEVKAKTLTRQIMHALDYLHGKNITHRDIKPDNILVYSNDPFIVKLSDFGLSKVVQEESFLKTFCGTLLYCAPEVYPDYNQYTWLGSETRKRRRHQSRQKISPYSQKVDTWSFGAVLYHMLSNKPPFLNPGDSRPPQMLELIMTTEADWQHLSNCGVSQDGVNFVASLLQKDPNLRPTDAECLTHEWVKDVDDCFKYDHYDNSQQVARFKLAAIRELDEAGSLDASQLSLHDLPSPANNGNYATPGGFPDDSDSQDGFASKRARGDFVSTPTPPQQLQDRPQTPAAVIPYPSLPEISPAPPIPTPTSGAIPGNRLFGEISGRSIFKSSEILPHLQPQQTGLSYSSSNSEDYLQDDLMDDDINLSDLIAGVEAASALAPLNPGQAILRRNGTVEAAPSLLGAEAQIQDLKMASSELLETEKNSTNNNQISTNITQAHEVAGGNDEDKMQIELGTENTNQSIVKSVEDSQQSVPQEVLASVNKDTNMITQNAEETSAGLDGDDNFSAHPLRLDATGTFLVNDNNRILGRRPSPVDYYDSYDPSTHNLEYASRVSGYDFVSEYTASGREASPSRSTRYSVTQGTEFADDNGRYRSRPVEPEYTGDPRRRINLPISPTLFYNPHDRKTQTLEYASKVSGHDFVSEYAAKSRATTRESTHVAESAETIDEKTGASVRRASSADSGSDIVIVTTDSQDQGRRSHSVISGGPVQAEQSANSLGSVTETTEFVRPQPRFGKLTSVEGSFITTTIRITDRFTSWGRHPNATIRWPDVNEARIPKIAFEVAFWAAGIEEKILQGQEWSKIEDTQVIISTKSSGCIWVNGVPLRFKGPDGASTLFGKLYTGDVITVYEHKDHFLKFKCQIDHGKSATPREDGNAFQVWSVPDKK